ncbi:hypothetical protein [Sporofaciens musculi]|uniref:hypothetical protein n=2 Tax=Sporofaciens musculi TaxID=2681861 RepID=UPI00258A1116|nr:hypothetical protein [Sporofaciens musculi]
MSELQKQAMEIIEEMSEENLKVLVKFTQIFIRSSNKMYGETDTHSVKKASKRIGIAEGEELSVIVISNYIFTNDYIKCRSRKFK